MVGVLQPPLPGAEHAELGGEEEHGGKQGVLGPQAVPAGVQHLQVAQVVEGAQHRGKEGEHQEGQPHRGAAALHQLRPETAQYHASYLLSDEQSPSHSEKEGRPQAQEGQIQGLRPPPKESGPAGGLIPFHPHQREQAVIPPGDAPLYPHGEEQGHESHEAAEDAA